MSLQNDLLNDHRFQLMSEANDLAPARCTRRYMICSLPRTGSTLITDALRRTGVAGLPAEYFNERSIRAYGDRFGLRKISVRDYVRFLEHRRTSAEGLFGVKMHYAHLSRFAAAETRNAYLQGFDRFVLVTRKNVVAQAISMVRAQGSGEWNTESPEDAERAKAKQVTYQSKVIAHWIGRILFWEEGWNEIFELHQRPVLRVTYEELASSHSAVMERIAGFLELTQYDPSALRTPRLVKLGDELNSEWQRRFLAQITGGE